MTLHVPHGLLISGALTDPFALSRALRTVTNAVATELVYARLANLVAVHIDQVRAGLRGSADIAARLAQGGDLLTAAAESLRADIRSAAASPYRSVDDLSLEVRLLAHPDHADRTLAIVRAQASKFREAITSLPGVSEYAYYMCETAPVAPERWSARKDVWTRALGPGFTSADAWIWSLYPDLPSGLATFPMLDAPRAREVLARIPDDAARTSRLAKALATPSREFGPHEMAALAEDLRAGAAAARPIAAPFIAPILASDLERVADL